MAIENVTIPGGETELNDLVNGTEGADIIDGLEGDDTVLAGGGDDEVNGGDGDDILFGEEGDDTLVGDRGADEMIGGDGDDRMIWNNGDGSDLMEGGDGYDTAEVNGSDSLGDTFRVRAGEDGRVDFARTNFGNFSLDIGSTEYLEIFGGGGDDFIQGGNGLADLIKLKLYGGDGNDTIRGGDGNDLIRGGADDDELFGGKGDDTLIGDGGADIMKGNDGNDRMIWNNGDGSDVMRGGADWDTAEVNGSDSSGDVFNIRAGEDGRVDFARINFGNFTLDIGTTEVLEVNGGGGDDVITGRVGLADLIKLELSGGAGNDTIRGGDGDDYISGGDDDDDLSGGQGDDVIVGDRGADIMKGNAGNDRMIWNNGDGSDVMEGGNGWDTAEVNGSDDAGDAFRISAGEDGRVDFERTNFGNFTLDIGSTEVLEVNGGGGNDFIKGEAGLAGLIDLKLSGGAGNDTLIGGDSDDHLSGGDDADVLIGGVGDDLLVGDRGNDIMEGGAGNDRMIWNNGDGSDIMEGGAGWDTVEVNGSDSLGDVFEISLGADGRVDFARTNFGNFTLDIGSSEVVELNGGGGDDVITAQNGLRNVVELRLSGGEGNDTITGGNGNDWISGGAGNDTMSGRAGADVFVFTEGHDTITDFQQGVDMVALGMDLPADFDLEGSLAQVGNDVVFTYEGESLTFRNELLEDFSADDFLL